MSHDTLWDSPNDTSKSASEAPPALHHEYVSWLQRSKTREDIVVESGDTLWQIARNSLSSMGHTNNTGPDILKEINRIAALNRHSYPQLTDNPNLVRPGMVLHLSQQPSEAAWSHPPKISQTAAPHEHISTSGRAPSAKETSHQAPPLEIWTSAASSVGSEANADPPCQKWSVREAGAQDAQGHQITTFVSECQNVIAGAGTSLVVLKGGRAHVLPGAAAIVLPGGRADVSGGMVIDAGGDVRYDPAVIVEEVSRTPNEQLLAERDSLDSSIP